MAALLAAPLCAEPLLPGLSTHHAFAIKAQPLPDALIEFAQQSGLQVSVDPSLLDGLRAQPVQGQLSSEQALDALLRDSGIEWRIEQSIITFRRAQERSSALTLDSTVVLGQSKSPFQGEEVIDRRAIENFAGANGDLTTLLKMHPNVRFDTTQQSSNTPGELSPADISINGAKFYQNNFMVDGISINNDLDPGASSGARSTINGLYNLPSHSFGLAIDADLLEEVRVYDSNVPAEYGRFNGGVVDAITRRPREGLHGKVSASMSRSEWTNYHINGDEISSEEFEFSSSQDNQPEFKKLTTRVTLEGHLTENFGLIGSFVRKSSEIPLYAYTGGFQSAGDSVKRKQTREIENYMLKGFWTPHERLDLSFTVVDAPAQGEYYKPNNRNSDFRIDQGGRTAMLHAVWSGDAATYTQKLSYKTGQSSRDSESSIYKPWSWSQEKNWGNPRRNGVLSSAATSVEGGMGDLEQHQSGFDYSFKAAFEPLELAGSWHRITFGGEVSRQSASYEVMEDSWSAAVISKAERNAQTSCVTASGQLDSEYCSISVNAVGTAERQFFRQLIYYRAGKIELDQLSYSLFLDDNVQIGRLNLRPGLRFDGDDYMDQKTIAPRFAASYDFFGDQSSVLSFGANRYYGRNLFKYRLADGRQSLVWRSMRPAAGAAFATIPDFAPMEQFGVNDASFRQLDIPYDDELMLGFAQHLAGLRFDLKYIHRDGRDQVVRSTARNLGLPLGDGVTNTTNYYAYANEGQSESQTVTLAISPLENLRFAGSETSWQLAFDWSRTQSSYADYERIFNPDMLENNDVYFNGKVMAYNELPTNNFNRPWTARLNAVTSIPSLNITWSNFFRYRGPYEQIYRASPTTINLNGSIYDHYTVGEVSAAPTWDTRIKWEIPTAPEQALYVAVDVTNVTDKVNSIVSDTGGTVSYEIGRQYWLEVGYTF